MAITPDEVAQWMLDELEQVKYLYQDSVVYGISSRFGEDFIYHNDNGNPAVGQKVLASFRKLTGDSVVWDRRERMWRFREPYDEPGRQQ